MTAVEEEAQNGFSQKNKMKKSWVLLPSLPLPYHLANHMQQLKLQLEAIQQTSWTSMMY